jgi:NitT/TauT family transport system substrate-binding protein
MWGHCYSVLPSGIYVREDSAIRGPEDLADVDIAVGYHSGSHFSTIQALEAFLDPGQIKLAFIGMPYDRVDALLTGAVPATAAWSAPSYILEQLGCRKILDTTFMAGFMFGAGTDAQTRPDGPGHRAGTVQGALCPGNPAPVRGTRGCAPLRPG